MKYLNNKMILMITLLMLLLSLILSSCTTSKQPIVDITILRDITDEQIRYTSYAEIREIFDFKKYLYYEHKVRVRELSDIRTGVSAESLLPAATEADIPENSRKSQVRGFLTQTEQILKTNSNYADKQQSHLYYSIGEELNRLALESKATNRIVIVNSNLLENNYAFSVYRDNDRRMLFEHPDSIIRIFERQIPLQNLKGVHIYLVHHSDPETDYLYTEMARLYSYYFGLKGAKVDVVANFISANIQNRNEAL